MFQKILVPHDFSECARRALDVALDIGSSPSATLILLHVSPLPPNLPPDALVTPAGSSTAMRVDEVTTSGARRELEAIAQPLRDRGRDVRTVARATTYDVSAELLRAADELGVDAIVLGTHGRTGLSHLLLGSVAEKVLRGARVPVVTVRSKGPETEPTAEEAAAEDELEG